MTEITFNGKQVTLLDGMEYRPEDTTLAGDYAAILYKNHEIVEDEQGYVMFIGMPDGALVEVETLAEAKEIIDKSLKTG